MLSLPFDLFPSFFSSDISELCATVGEIKKLEMHYDAKGQSMGVVDVLFFQRTVALKCLEKFNDVPLDGRKMR